MSLSNSQIATQLSQLGQLLQSQGENRFKVKAYKTAAEALRQYPKKVVDLIGKGEDLTQIPGIGKGISAAITEIVQSGQLSMSKSLSKDLPEGTMVLAEAVGISIKEAQSIIKKLKVSSVEELQQKLESGELLEKLGTRFDFKVRQGLLKTKRILWWDAEDLSDSLLKFIEKLDSVKRVEPAGSFRRKRETVGSLRFVLEAEDEAAVVSAIEGHGGVEDLQERKNGRYTFTLSAGPLLSVRFTESKNWGGALVEETGSLAHLAELKKSSKVKVQGKQFKAEDDLYEAYGLLCIAPELREGRGEVSAARAKKLPELVSLEDIKGDLHAHTTASDGSNSIMEMVKAAKKRGYSYLAITDHSQSLKITNGLDVKRLRKQMEDIDRLNEDLKGFRILKGSEVDILQDGTLDFPDEVLEELDIVVCSIHSRFGLDKKQQTARILRVVENRYSTFLGHMTGRLLLKRPGYELDTDKILKAVKENGKFIEINSSPDRLDIDDELAQRARELAIPLVINTDAHSTGELDYMRIGVQQARRGWQSAKDVINTLPLTKLLSRIRSTRH